MRPIQRALFVAAVAGIGCAAKLPDVPLGSAVPGGARNTGRMVMVSPSTLQPEWAWRFDGVDYSVGVDGRGKVRYLATDSTKVVTPEGVHVGQAFSDVQRVPGVRVGAWPGWGYFASLPSGWNAAFFIGRSMTEREPVAADPVALLFRKD
jgi:hypothetical protein